MADELPTSMQQMQAWIDNNHPRARPECDGDHVHWAVTIPKIPEPGGFLIQFDHRSDGGPRLVGPFDTKLAAELYVQRLVGQYDSFHAEWGITPIYPPEV